ncbi:tetratricopeptide repeat protein [bacterium]|nr:tetratricopeptide repeat protein [bacterium]
MGGAALTREVSLRLSRMDDIEDVQAFIRAFSPQEDSDSQWVEMNHGRCLMRGGDSEEGIRHLDNLLGEVNKDELPYLYGWIVVTMAFGYRQVGDLETGKIYAKEALKIAQEKEDKGMEAMASRCMAYEALMKGEYHDVKFWVERALNQDPDPTIDAYMALYLAQALAGSSQFQDADEVLHAAQNLLPEDSSQSSTHKWLIAYLRLQAGWIEGATPFLDQPLPSRAPHLKVWVLGLRALLRNEFKEALVIFSEALDAFKEAKAVGHKVLHTLSYFLVAQSLLEDWEGMVTTLTEMKDVKARAELDTGSVQTLLDLIQESETNEDLGRIKDLLGEVEDCADLLLAAQVLSHKSGEQWQPLLDQAVKKQGEAFQGVKGGPAFEGHPFVIQVSAILER